MLQSSVAIYNCSSTERLQKNRPPLCLQDDRPNCWNHLLLHIRHIIKFQIKVFLDKILNIGDKSDGKTELKM